MSVIILAYEFSDENALVIKKVALRFKTQAILLALVGLVTIISTIVHWEDSTSGVQIYKIIQASLFFVIAVVIYRPSDNFEKIDKTKGNDIGELMTGIRDLKLAFPVMVVMILLMVVIDIIIMVIS